MMAVWMNQGSPRQTRMSNTLLPTALLTAMSPRPSFITAREDRASGTLTPAATNVRPMTVSGMPKVLPVNFIHLLVYQLKNFIFTCWINSFRRNVRPTCHKSATVLHDQSQNKISLEKMIILISKRVKCNLQVNFKQHGI